MSGRHWFVVGAASVVVATAAAAAASALRHGLDGPVDVPFVLVTLALGAAFVAVGGLLVAVRRRNVLGPLLVVSGTALVAEMALREVVYDAVVGGAPRDWARVLAWTSSWLDVLGLPLPLVAILLLFPDGRLPTARWRPVLALALVVGAVRLALFVLGPGPLRLDSHALAVPWTGIVDLRPATYDRIESATGGAVILLLLAAAASLLVRFWTGGPETRQRLTPLGLAVSTIVLGVLLQAVPGLSAAGVVVFVIGGASVPVALTVGALRHRVWDLDPLLVKAITYAGLAVLLTVLYVVVIQSLVLVLGVRYDNEGLLPSVAATVVVAAALSPARQRLERAARRLVFGERADPYATLAALPQRLVEAPTADEVLPATAETIARGLGVELAGVSVLLRGDGTRSAWYPGRPDGNGPVESLEVRHLGEPVGRLYVVPGPDRALSRDDHRLLADLAAQAGPALRAVALSAELTDRLEQITAQSEELARSRQRIVVAQSQERRRLQRDLHDGVQQRLVASAMQLGTIRALVGTDPERVLHELGELDTGLRSSLDEIREVSRGLHPSTLAARGLLASLRTRAGVSRQHVEVHGDGLDGVRLDAEIEAAAYYCCLEALQNAAKHAPDAAVVVRLSLTDDRLSWTVCDNGPGFTGPADAGSGLVGMRDRVAALGGELDVVSSEAGTVVRGALPRDLTPSG